MRTEWKPHEFRTQVCLLFDEISFPIGDPTSATLESAATLSKDPYDIDLSKCVVDNVEVISTEIHIERRKDDDQPIFFFLKLYSADKLLTPTVLCSVGHPVSKTCNAKTYFKRVKDEREERLTRDFAAFLPWEEKTIGMIQNDSKAFKTLLQRVSNLSLSELEPVTEKKSGFPKFRPEEHDRDLDAWDSTIRHQVEKCFHNMTSIRGELSAVGNENRERTNETSPILVRIVLDIQLRATKI